MTSSSHTCTRCPAPARWRDGDGRHYCAGHVPANGKPLARLPEDRSSWAIVHRLEAAAARRDGDELCAEAAAEIRRLRAELDKSGSC